VGNLEKGALWALRSRANQIYKKYFKGGGSAEKIGITKSELISSYAILLENMTKRGMIFKSATELDSIVSTKMKLGIDLTALEDACLIPNFIVLADGFIAKGEKKTVVVKASGLPKVPGLDLKKLLKNLNIDRYSVSYDDSSWEDGLPVYDLYLRARPFSTVVKNPGDTTPVGDSVQKTRMKFKKLSSSKHIVGGIVYEPEELDTDGEWATAEDIEQAAHFYMEKSQGVKVMHDGEYLDMDAVCVLESFIAEEKTTKDGGIVPEGAWYMKMRINDPNLWMACKEGELTGFSMAGFANIIPEIL